MKAHIVAETGLSQAPGIACCAWEALLPTACYDVLFICLLEVILAELVAIPAKLLEHLSFKLDPRPDLERSFAADVRRSNYLLASLI